VKSYERSPTLYSFFLATRGIYNGLTYTGSPSSPTGESQ
jgi:hypothetical protein